MRDTSTLWPSRRAAIQYRRLCCATVTLKFLSRSPTSTQKPQATLWSRDIGERDLWGQFHGRGDRSRPQARLLKHASAGAGVQREIDGHGQRPVKDDGHHPVKDDHRLPAEDDDGRFPVEDDDGWFPVEDSDAKHGLNEA